MSTDCGGAMVPTRAGRSAMQVMRRGLGRTMRAGAGLALVLVLAGCGANRTFNRANDAAQAGEWDVAVEQFRAALQADPDNPEYRIALQRAMLNATTHYSEQGRIAEARGQLDVALRAYRRANDFDLGNRSLASKVTELEKKLRDEAQAAIPPSTIEQLRQAVRPAGPPALFGLTEVLPVLNFSAAPVRQILETIGMSAGINVTFERDFQEPRQTGYSVVLDGVTLEQALTQVTSANGFFYKVLNERTIMVIQDTQQKRNLYDDQEVKVLRLSHADATEVATIITQVLVIPNNPQQFRISANKTQNSITVRAPTNIARIIDRIVETLDGPRAEIVVDVEILEVNKRRMKQYGLDLGDYTIGAVFSPEVDPRSGSTVAAPAINAQSLSGVSRDDFYLTLPSAAIRFLESDSETKLLAKPQLRGTEGAELTLSLGDEIPIPSTTYTPIAQGGANVNPLTSFTYRTIGIVLKMTPKVTYEDEILLTVEVENSARGGDVTVGGSTLPSFSTRKVTAQLRLRDGETNMIAGLISEVDRRSARGLPGLLRVPILRQLFANNDSTIEQTDVVVLLKPRIVRTHELTTRDLESIFIGTGGSLGLGGPPPLIAQPDIAPVTPAPAPQPPPAQPGAQPPAIPPVAQPPAAEPPPGAAAQPPPQPVRDPAPAPGAGASLTPTPPGGGGRILLSPSATDLRVGVDGLIVPITADNVSRLSRVALTVTYNPATLRVRAVQQGTLMGSGGGAVSFTEDHAVPGRIDIVIMRPNDSAGVSGTGQIAAVLFEPIASGAANLNVTGVASVPGGGPLPMQFVPSPAVTVK
jgi:general secretion pathway protein D